MAARKARTAILLVLPFVWGGAQARAEEPVINHSYTCEHLPPWVNRTYTVPAIVPEYPDYSLQTIVVGCPCGTPTLDPNRVIKPPTLEHASTTWQGQKRYFPFRIHGWGENPNILEPLPQMYKLYGTKPIFGLFAMTELVDVHTLCRKAESRIEHWTPEGGRYPIAGSYAYELPPVLNDTPLELLYVLTYDITSHNSVFCTNCQMSAGYDFITSRTILSGVPARLVKVVKHSHFVVDGQSFANPEHLHLQKSDATRMVDVEAVPNYPLTDEELQNIGWTFVQLGAAGQHLPTRINAANEGVYRFAVIYQDRPQDNYEFVVEVGDWD